MKEWGSEKRKERKEGRIFSVKVRSDFQSGNDELLMYCPIFCILCYPSNSRMCVQIMDMYSFMSKSSLIWYLI